MNGTLEYEECERCAVGNIVAGNLGIAPEWGKTSNWANVINVGSGTLYKEVTKMNRQEGLIEIEATGHTPQNLADVELAFYIGTSKKIYSSKEEENF